MRASGAITAALSALLLCGPVTPLTASASPPGPAASTSLDQPPARSGLPAERCRGVRATMVGTDGRDHLVGTPHRDVIVAGRGWDQVSGRGGDDLVCGGRGADHLSGGVGRDRVYGGADGLLFGEDQYGDVLFDGPGADVLDGGPGLYRGDRGLDELRFPLAASGVTVDLLRGVAQVDGTRNRVSSIEDVAGTSHDDGLYGDDAYQTISGRGGDDVIGGRGGIDFLNGQTGDDRLVGGRGSDYLDGGPGIDEGFGGPSSGDGDFCQRLEVQHGCEH